MDLQYQLDDKCVKAEVPPRCPLVVVLYHGIHDRQTKRLKSLSVALPDDPMSNLLSQKTKGFFVYDVYVG